MFISGQGLQSIQCLFRCWVFDRNPLFLTEFLTILTFLRQILNGFLTEFSRILFKILDRFCQTLERIWRTFGRFLTEFGLLQTNFSQINDQILSDFERILKKFRRKLHQNFTINWPNYSLILTEFTNIFLEFYQIFDRILTNSRQNFTGLLTK